MASALLIALSVLLATATCVQGQGGSLTVKLSEADFANHEEDGNLNITLTVTIAGITPGTNQLEFSFEALTQAQYNARLASPENSFECSPLSPQGDDVAEEDDLVMTTVTCSGDPPTAQDNAVTLVCSIPITQDGVYEGDEYLVLIMTVSNDGGNTVEVDRNCAIGRILANNNPADFFDFTLTTLSGPLVVTEGDTLNVEITRNFPTELPIEVSIRGDGIANSDNQIPFEGEDFSLEQRNIMFQPNQDTLIILFEFFENMAPELTENLRISITATIQTASGNAIDVPIQPPTIVVSILDNDLLTSGFERNETAITVTEGDSIQLCVEFKDFNLFGNEFLERPVVINLTTTTNDNSATIGTDYTVMYPEVIDILQSFAFPCYTIQTAGNDQAERTRTFQAVLVDERLALITDPGERQAHMQLNVINPGTITINIEDDDGTPNTPIVVFGNGPTFQWQTDEEDEARPVNCHYGNVTVRTPEGSENVVQFDFCDGFDGPGSEFDLPDFDTSNMYTVIVCSQNRLGTSCTEPLIHTPPPPTIAPPTTTAPPITIAVPGMTGLQSGAIVGIVVGGVLLGCCLLWLLLLLLLLLCCCCKRNREKRYFPQKREEMFSKQGHKHDAHYSVTDSEFDAVKVPLD